MRLAWSLDQIRRLVDELFCQPEGRYGSYTRLQHGDDEVLDGMLFRFRLQGADESLVYELHVYGPIDEVSGLLWQNQARALLRLNALDHPSLPDLRDMAFDDEHKLAFSLTESVGEDLVLDDLLVRARHHPAEAARAYGLLIDAVVELHDLRLHHRNISPGALRVAELTDRGGGPDTGADSYRLTLNRFEMSSLLGDLLRGDAVEAQIGREQVREMYKRGHGPHISSARHLVYMPPERLQFLFSDELDAGRYEELSSDLYGLAVLGWELFVGSVECELADQLAAVVSADDPAETLLDVNRAMRLRLRNDRTLPPTLIDLFDRALDPAPSARPSTFEFANEFNRDWDHLIGRWELQEIEQPYLVAYMPAEFSSTLYRYQRWLQVDPADESGRDEIRSFFEMELKRARLVHWPTGAAGIVRQGKDLDRQTWVLVGEKAVWFCSPLELGIANRPVEEALIIRAYKPIAEAQEVARARPWRRVPAIESFAFQPYQSEDVRHRISGHPSWARLMSSVKTGRSAFVEDHEFLQSIRFLLEYQQAQLDSRTYAYEEIEGESKRAGVHILRTDRRRDLANLHRSPLLSAFSGDSQRRPPLGELFEDLEGEEARALVARDEGGRPASGNSWLEGTVARSLDDGTIEIQARGRVTLPPTGWIRPWSDRGSWAALSRQQRVWPLLERNRSLVRSLREPWAFDLGLGRWEGNAGDLGGADRTAGPAPEGTVGATEAVPHMLGYEPLYALQGPPGSGKTTVAVQALKAFFAKVPTARVLVSAQSNDALDNIGNKLIKELSDDVVIVRIVSDQREGDLQGATAGKVLHRLTEQTVTDAVAHAAELRQQGHLPVHDQELLSLWQEVVTSGRIELSGAWRPVPTSCSPPVRWPEPTRRSSTTGPASTTGCSWRKRPRPGRPRSSSRSSKAPSGR